MNIKTTIYVRKITVNLNMPYKTILPVYILDENIFNLITHIGVQMQLQRVKKTVHILN